MATVGVFLARFDGGHMGWDHGRPGWRIGIMILLVAILVGVAVWAVVRSTRAGHAAAAPSAPPADPTARNVLDQRFARGEIDAADYEERRRLLNS